MIAHNRCIDFLRRRQAQREAEAAAPASTHPPEAVGKGVDRAIEQLVIALPPKERACVLLKDVFDYSLEDIADLVESKRGSTAARRGGEGRLQTLPAAGTTDPEAPSRN